MGRPGGLDRPIQRRAARRLGRWNYRNLIVFGVDITMEGRQQMTGTSTVTKGFQVLPDLTYDSCLVYLDDVIVVGRTFHEQLFNLRKVFQRFREAHLKMNPEKCQVFREKSCTWDILCHRTEYPSTLEN
jgi:hypothetical protein